MQPDPQYIAAWHANLKAKKLRDRGVSYRDIAIAMEELLDQRRSPKQWRQQLRKQGCPPRPHGGQRNLLKGRA